MKTHRNLSSVLATVVSLFFVGSLAAAPGLGGGTAGGSGGSGHGSGGGASIAGASSGGGHISLGGSAGSHATFSGGSPGFRGGTALSGGATHYLPGGTTPNVSGQLSARSRPAGMVSASRPVTASQQVTTAPQLISAARNRPANAWTDSRNSINRQTNRATIVGRADRSAAAYRQYLANGQYNGQITPDVVAGSYLYPGVYGSTLNNFYNGQSPRGLSPSGDRRVRSFAKEDRWYGPHSGRHAYWPNGYYPYFGGYGYPFFGSYGGYGDGVFGAYDGDGNVNSAAVVPYAPDQSVATVEDGAPTPHADAEPEGNAQANLPAGTLGNGPDSLVEAVQAELARRGYFSGKIDAIYGAETKDALSRFQKDQKLNATGRVNEATLHALQLD